MFFVPEIQNKRPWESSKSGGVGETECTPPDQHGTLEACGFGETLLGFHAHFGGE